MKILRIEWPDEHHAQLFRLSYAKIKQHAGIVMATYARRWGGKAFARPWCAEIMPDGGLKFLRGFRDYSNAIGVGERGVYMEYQLQDGHRYRVREWTAEKGERTYSITA